MEAMLLVTILIVCLYIIFWFFQFVQLMLLSDADFPGRYDKCLWTAAFILAFVIAPVAFFGWKHAYRAMLASRAESRRHEA